MSQASKDIQNNNFQVGPFYPVTQGTAPDSALGGGGADDSMVSDIPLSSSVLAQFVAQNIDNLGEESSPSSISSITYNDEYLEDPLPELTLENLHIHKDYVDPSLGYVFVNNLDNHQGYLDNSQALLQQLEDLGVRVSDEDYYTLDFEVNTTSSVDSIVSNMSDSTSVSATKDGAEGDVLTGKKREDKESFAKGSDFIKEVDNSRSLPTCGASNFSSEKDANLEKLIKLVEEEIEEYALDIEDLDHEVAEAEILPSGGVKVTYDNYKKDYRPRISSHQNFMRYLALVHDRTEETSKAETKPQIPAQRKQTLDQYKRLLFSFHKKLNISEKVTSLSALPNKYTKKILKMLAEEMTYDAMTPDSGVHENFTNLTADEQEKQREEWKAELIKTEEEIQTLRQVLGSKVKHAQDLKRRLGITVWREFTEDFNQSMKSVRESQTSQYVQSLQVYQKTAGAIGAVGEKTSSLFGGIGAKFGQLKETPTFKSFEERVGGVYSAARQTTRMGGSGSNSTQDFEEALKEAEGEKAAANGGTVAPSTTTPGTEVSQPTAS